MVTLNQMCDLLKSHTSRTFILCSMQTMDKLLFLLVGRVGIEPTTR